MKAYVANILLLLTALLLTPMAWAQDDAVDPNNPPPPPAYSQQQLDQMLAPIALYPDALLSQVLEAATYPLEVVQAARWSRAHPDLNGDAAVQQAKQNNWDPSVLSLTAFPQILQQMDDKLDWTQQLGDAFLAQQPQVMDTVQNLRQKASAAGNLQSNQQITVVTQPQTQTIVIQQAAPQVVYVPYYNPTVVYGPWWWDAYPPVYWNPWPGYAYSGVRSGFYFGSGISISAGFFYSNVDWHRRHVNIVNVNNYYYNNRQLNNYRGDNRPPGSPGSPRPGGDRDDRPGDRQWQHDPGHRRGVAYPNAALQQQFSRDNSPADLQRAQRNGARIPQQNLNRPDGQGNPGRNQAGNSAGGANPDHRQDAHPDAAPGQLATNRNRGDGSAANADNRNNGDNGARNGNRRQDTPNNVRGDGNRPDTARPSQQGNLGNPTNAASINRPARTDQQSRPVNAVRQERQDNLPGLNNHMDSHPQRANVQRENVQQERIQAPAQQPRQVAAPVAREPARQEAPRQQAEPRESRGNQGERGGERRER